MGVSMGELFNTLQVYLGSLYVNDFNRFGRTWQVNVQAASDFRKQIEDLKQLKIRSDTGKMVPLGTLATVEDRSGPVLIMRYNMYPAAAVNITPEPGVSSGQAIERTDGLVRQEFSRSMRYRVDRAGAAPATDRQHGHATSSAGGGAGLPGAGGAVRELVVAAGSDPGRAHVPAVFDRRRSDGPHGHQHLHAGRLRGAGGPGLQERHLDRGVRQGPPRIRDGSPASDAWRPASSVCGRS